MKRMVILLVLVILSFGSYANEIKIPQKRIEQIKAIKSEFKNNSLELKNNIIAQINKMDELLMSEASEEEIKKEFKLLKELRNKHQSLRLESLLKMRRILPLEERAFLKFMKGPGGRGKNMKGSLHDQE
jgi:Spy/CpxP family protein refolding chaperone